MNALFPVEILLICTTSIVNLSSSPPNQTSSFYLYLQGNLESEFIQLSREGKLARYSFHMEGFQT